MRNILITGSSGFVGKNLYTFLKRRKDIIVIPFDREDTLDTLASAITSADFIFHLAGANRPSDPSDFMKVNKGL
ncbi:MAG: NAD-dependent epimerase/dehydratase family protein, partial [Bacteroidales bacterium]|nr:NAD-dependent epimerase/dehydratase family protein [Bacteroidales bacterium]